MGVCCSRAGSSMRLACAVTAIVLLCLGTAAGQGVQSLAESEGQDACGTAKDGKTKTGPSRNGHCALASQDTHAVCVTMPQGFCGDTGQSNWCTPFVGGPWCICMWAYATYVEKHGCDSIKVHLSATDKAGICQKYTDDVGGGGKDLSRAKQCLGC